MKELFCDFDKKTFNITIFTQKLSFFVSLIGIIGLFICLRFYADINLYYISIAMFKAGFLGSICSLCFGVFFNGLKKGLIPR